MAEAIPYFKPDADGKLHPRESVLHRKLSRNQPVYMFKSNIPHPMVVELLGMAGADCLWLDTEHFPTDVHAMAQLARAARGVDTDSMIRVPNGEYMLAARMLDMGGNGIMYPRVTDVDDVKRLVDATRYRPQGNRGTDFGCPAGGYGQFDVAEAAAWANAQVKLMIQIETPEAIDRIDDIAAVEGISILFIGPSDLSFALDQPCDPSAPHIVDTMQKTADAAQQHGLDWGMPIFSAEHGQRVLELGGRLLAQAGGDTTWLARTVKEKRAEMDQIAQPYGGL